ncbi:MAG: 2Fe-2S iron-sulfur cluster-binding protein [[Clostridium] scindens]
MSAKKHEPRGYFCGIGRCTNCVMTVNGDRMCVPVSPCGRWNGCRDTDGLGKWEESK